MYSNHQQNSCKSKLNLQHGESLQQAPFAGPDSNKVRGKQISQASRSKTMVPSLQIVQIVHFPPFPIGTTLPPRLHLENLLRLPGDTKSAGSHIRLICPASA